MNKFHYIESISFTDTGLLRTNNEDSFCMLPEDGCFLVSDGMGGGEAGEVASQLVEETVESRISGSSNDFPGNRKYIIQQALHHANDKIQQYTNQHNYRQMGATVALLLFDSWDARKALVCHVGDSRIYRLRNHKLTPLTSDHTIAVELKKRMGLKKISGNQNSVISHILTRAVGTSGCILPEWKEIDVFPEDLFLICSDGVTTMISDRQIQEILDKNSLLEEITSDLTSAVCQAGATDNFTFILCKIARELPMPEEHSKEDTDENNYLLKIAEERIDHE